MKVSAPPLARQSVILLIHFTPPWFSLPWLDHTFASLLVWIVSSGSNCDFKHPTAPDGTVTNRVCEYWGTGRGCLKSNECKFLHPIRYAPTGAPATKVCDFYLTAQGCVKSNRWESGRIRWEKIHVADSFVNLLHSQSSSHFEVHFCVLVFELLI